MKKIYYLFLILPFLAGAFVSCENKIDNSYSRFNSTVEVNASSVNVVLNEDTPDDVALTVTWTPAYDYGPDFIMTYQYTAQMLGSSVVATPEYEDNGIFERSYTHEELQTMLVDKFGLETSTYGEMKFTVSASYEGPYVVIPDEASVTVKVKTYGAKQFKADKVTISGSAVGSQAIEVSPSSADANIYVWTGELAAGKFNFPIVYADENNVIIPASGADETVTGSSMDAVVVGQEESSSSVSWVIPEADSYRITLNFSNRTVTVMKTSDIIEIDKLFIGGTSASGVSDDAREIKQTLENENLYAWKGELQAGTLFIPVEYSGATAVAIVPSGSSNDLNDGQTVSFGQVSSSDTDTRYWSISSAGTYRIVINKDLKTIAIYSQATDMPLREYSWNNTADVINPYTAPVENLWMWGDFDSKANGNVPSDDYMMTPSLASPYIFTYSGTLGSGSVKFLVSNKWNNVYAFGASDERDKIVTAELDVTYTMVGGQGNNRYSRYKIPEGTNFIVVDITDDSNPTVVFSQK